MPRALLIPLVVVLAYAGLCLALYLFQRSLIYFPGPRAVTEEDHTLRLPTPAGDVVVTVRGNEGPDALVYFGGNAEDVSLNLAPFTAWFPGHAIHLLHYRGYGGSAGSPSEEALTTDALALYDTVSARHRRIVVIGRSLGAAIAVRVASRRPAARLVLVTPFDSLEELAAKRFFFVPVSLILKDTYQSGGRAPLVTAPTLIVAAEHDEVIPRTSAERLFARFREGTAELRILAGTGHNTIQAHPEYMRLLAGSP